MFNSKVEFAKRLVKPMVYVLDGKARYCRATYPHKALSELEETPIATAPFDYAGLVAACHSMDRDVDLMSGEQYQTWRIKASFYATRVLTGGYTLNQWCDHHNMREREANAFIRKLYYTLRDSASLYFVADDIGRLLKSLIGAERSEPVDLAINYMATEFSFSATTSMLHKAKALEP